MGRGEAALVKLMSPLAMVVVAATVLCCVLGFVLAKQADDYFESAHRQALRDAVEALQAASPDLGEVDPKLIRILESASGLKGLRLAEEPPPDAREVQSLIDSKGRIVGWFTWEPERPATAMITQLLPFGGLIALGLFGFAVLAMWQLRRLDWLLAAEHAASAETRLRGSGHRAPQPAPDARVHRPIARQAAAERTGGGRADRSRRLRRDEGSDRRRRRGRGADRDRQPAAPRGAEGRAGRAPARRQVRPGDARGRRRCGACRRAGDARRGLARDLGRSGASGQRQCRTGDRAARRRRARGPRAPRRSCAARRPSGAAAASSCSSPSTWRAISTSGGSSSASCRARSRRARSSSTISRSCGRTAAPSSAWSPCCAGTIRAAAISRRACSCGSRRRPG